VGFGLLDTFSKPLTELLVNWEKGDKDALNAILPFVYDELRRIAHRCLQRERPNHTIQSTALVHEAYLRLAKQRPRHFEDRNHFVALAAQLMRYIVVDYARNHGALKRGAGVFKLELDDRLALPDKQVDLLALDDALKSLQEVDAQQSRLVELRFFGGLSIEEASDVLGVSPATLKRQWTTARAYLYRQMRH
jgi:RNA polymerase sigma factor (TIGR02999 family)